MTTTIAQPARATRRADNRAATESAIRASARELLVSDGVTGVTLRPIARSVGLTAPALYRYYPSREHLLRDLIADLYDELGDALETELAAAKGAGADLTARFVTATQGFRRWALQHPAEFGLLFATPISTVLKDEDERLNACGQRFGAIFLGLFAELWVCEPFPIQPDAGLDPRLAAQLRRWADTDGIELPLGALAIFLACWTKLYGLICMELFGHLGFALDDVDPMFDQMLTELAGMLGLDRDADRGAGD